MYSTISTPQFCSVSTRLFHEAQYIAPANWYQFTSLRSPLSAKWKFHGNKLMARVSSSGGLRKPNTTYGLRLGLYFHTRAACCRQELFYITTLLSVTTIHSVGGGWNDCGVLMWWYGLVNRNIRGKKIVPVPPQNPHRLIWDRTREHSVERR